jgi:hypothetical protein
MTSASTWTPQRQVRAALRKRASRRGWISTPYLSHLDTYWKKGASLTLKYLEVRLKEKEPEYIKPIAHPPFE